MLLYTAALQRSTAETKHITLYYSCVLQNIRFFFGCVVGIAEFAGLENDGLENDGVEQEQTYILHMIN